MTRSCSPTRCPDCGGSGIDKAKTKKLSRSDREHGSYVMCWNCQGNGDDPIARYSWDYSELMRAPR